MNETLMSASDTAGKTVQELHAAARSEAEAQRQTRTAVRELAAAVATNRQELLRQRMNLELQKTLADIDRALADLLRQNADRRRAQVARLEPVINAALQPLTDRIAEYHRRADDAFAKFKASPNELELRQQVVLADKDYLAAQGAAVDLKLDALKQGFQQLDLVEAETATRLQQVAERHRANAQKVYDRAVTALPAVAAPALDLGPEPQVPDAAYDGLFGYTQVTKAAAEGNRDYLRSNAFGSGSYFAGFWQSLGKGLLGGVMQPSPLKPADVQAVTTAGRDVFDAAFGSLKDQFADAKSSFAAEGQQVLEQTAAALADKAQQSVEQFLKGKLNLLGSGATPSQP